MSTDIAPTVEAELRPVRRVEADDALINMFPTMKLVGSRLSLGEYFKSMWDHREFAATVPLGQLKATNQDTSLGRLWNLLHPLLLIGIYFLIFQVFLGINSRRGVDNYLTFLTVGVITYNFTRTSMHGGALSIVKNRKLIQSLYFPRAILPFSAIVAKSTSHLYSVGVMLIMLVVFGNTPAWTWLALPFVLIVHAAMNLGFAFFTARFTYHFRDFEKFLAYILRLALYISGVLIPINYEIISNPWLLRMLRANPIFAVIGMTRQTLNVEPFELQIWIVGTVWAIVLLIAGFFYFRSAEANYASV